MFIFERIGIFINTLQSLICIFDNFLRQPLLLVTAYLGLAQTLEA